MYTGPSTAPRPLPALDVAPLDPTPRPPTLLDPYLTPTTDGFRFRPATTLADAETVRRLVRAAWKLRAPDRYFYDLFERPLDVLTRLIDPLLDATDLRSLDAICLIAEQDGEAFGTMSLVLDHAARTVELGRGAIDPTRRSSHLVTAILRLLNAFTDYDVIVDATVAQPGAGRCAIGCGALPVGLYPSTFVFQPGCVDDWLDTLRRTQGDEETDAMVHHSPRTGLGRFMTACHLRPADRRAPYAPNTTARQRPLAAWTRRALDLPTLAIAQPDRAAPMRVEDMLLTATRTICHAPADLDIDHAMRDAIVDGIETLVIRVPCDAMHRPFAARLDARDVLLGGLHPDRDGFWSAGYVIPLGEGHAAAVRDGLRVMAQLGQPRIYAPLLRVVVEVNGLG